MFGDGENLLSQVTQCFQPCICRNLPSSVEMHLMKINWRSQESQGAVPFNTLELIYYQWKLIIFLIMLNFLSLVHLGSLCIQKKSFHGHQWKIDLPSCAVKYKQNIILFIEFTWPQERSYFVALCNFDTYQQKAGVISMKWERICPFRCAWRVHTAFHLFSTSSEPPPSKVWGLQILNTNFSRVCRAFSLFHFFFLFFLFSFSFLCVWGGCSLNAEFYYSWKITTLWKLPQGKNIAARQQLSLQAKQSLPAQSK